MLGLVVVAAGCAARVPVITTPVYPSFVFPGVPVAYVDDARVASAQRDAWIFLQGGNLDRSEQHFLALLGRDDEFFPALTGLGWVELARGNYAEAIAHFDLALTHKVSYVPALVGRGDALLANENIIAALQTYESVLRYRALFSESDSAALERVERVTGELQFQMMTERLSDARIARAAGQLDLAETAYKDVISASPDSAFLYLEFAQLKQQQGQLSEALVEVRRSQKLDETVAAGFLLEGELLEATGDLVGAADVYRRTTALDPSGVADAELTRVLEVLHLATLPEAYREIASKTQITRGDLAALIGVRLSDLVREAAIGQSTPIFTDTRDHWATAWIAEVTRAGLMRVDGRYQFEPSRMVRRGDLAGIVADVIDLMIEESSDISQQWREAIPNLSDMAEGHLNYESASLSVAAGVLHLFEGDRFEPTRVVSGVDANAVMQRLLRLTQTSN